MLEVMQIKKRNIGVCLLLSIVTLGIYDIYWMYLLVKNTRLIQNDTGDCIGEMLCLIFVPFYSLYWWYTRGEKVKNEFCDHNCNSTGNGIVYLILAFFYLNIVSMLIMQSDFNTLNWNINIEQQGTLEIKNLRKVFNKGTVNEKVAIKNLSLSLEEGDFVTVIGGNGAGKSTLLNSIAGTYPVDGGSITLGGVELTKLPDFKRAKYVSRVFQDPLIGTAGNMNLEENLALAARRGKSRGLGWGITAKEREEYRQMLEKLDLGLDKVMGQKVSTLSGGQRQALTLLMASLSSPKLLLLDEHTAALDPKTAAKVLSLTNDIYSREKLTVLMITHNMSDAIKYGNKLLMMNEGDIVYFAEGEEKKSLTIPFLMQKFEQKVGEGMTGDKMLLG